MTHLTDADALTHTYKGRTVAELEREFEQARDICQWLAMRVRMYTENGSLMTWQEVVEEAKTKNEES